MIGNVHVLHTDSEEYGQKTEVYHYRNKSELFILIEKKKWGSEKFSFNKKVLLKPEICKN